MKNLILILIFVFSVINSYGQFNQNYTTESYDSNVNTNDNTTKIKLFDIEYNGDKIPLNIYYTHTGIKVDEQPSSLGMHWKMDNIGIIKTTVNHLNDYSNFQLNNKNYKGWFNSLDPDFSNSLVRNSCPDIYSCTGLSAMDAIDLSPDFFSVRLANANTFDFFYKKNITNGIIGTPIPTFLSNPNGYKINTDFSNFINQSITQSNPLDLSVVFNILDKYGNKYDFFKGINTSNGTVSYCDFYLKSLTNNSNQDFVNISYITKEVYYEKAYTTGVNVTNQYNGLIQYYSCGNDASCNSDYENNIVRDYSSNVYGVSESRLDFKKIITNRVIIDFIYTTDNENLDEISITDINGNYITGYKFIYQNFAGTTTKTLFQLKKYNSNKTLQELVYEFKYNDGKTNDYENIVDFFALNKNSQGGQKQNYMDYFGYYNGLVKSNFLPLRLLKIAPIPLSYTNFYCSIIPSGNFQPILDYAKCYSLFSMKNKYGGITKFEYQLNQKDNTYYGGGLLISSIKKEPITGKASLVNYTYENPSGFFLKLINPDFQFISATFTMPAQQIGGFNFLESKYKYYSSVPVLYNIDTIYPGDGDLVHNPHISGNFFNKVTETYYDFDTMQLQSSIVKEYVSNYEGTYRTPIINSQLFKNSLNQEVKKINYFNTYNYLEQVDRSVLKINGHSTVFENTGYYSGIVNKHYSGFDLNRVYLNRIEENTYSSAGTLTENTILNYVNPDSRILRSKSFVNSLGENMEERYYYANDIEMQYEPLVTNLISKNIIGVPLKIETYKGTEKLSETKTVYAQDATTNNLLVPKYVYAKKGNDASAILEKKITYDLYDDKGNLIQYTLDSGVPVSLIWGYNKTKLIAKIENATYNSITSLITAAQTASNTGTEAALITALSNLRNSSLLANALVTSYTHLPLKGISTVTDSKGYIIYYYYDSFGRLSSVKDASGNILKENQYNYKPQL